MVSKSFLNSFYARTRSFWPGWIYNFFLSFLVVEVPSPKITKTGFCTIAAHRFKKSWYIDKGSFSRVKLLEKIFRPQTPPHTKNI